MGLLWLVRDKEKNRQRKWNKKVDGHLILYVNRNVAFVTPCGLNPPEEQTGTARTHFLFVYMVIICVNNMHVCVHLSTPWSHTAVCAQVTGLSPQRQQLRLLLLFTCTDLQEVETNGQGDPHSQLLQLSLSFSFSFSLSISLSLSLHGGNEGKRVYIPLFSLFGKSRAHTHWEEIDFD